MGTCSPDVNWKSSQKRLWLAMSVSSIAPKMSQPDKPSRGRAKSRTKPWPRKRRATSRAQEGPPADDGRVRLFGVHAVEAALANPNRTLTRLLATENAARRLAMAIGARGIAAETVSPRDLDKLLGADTVHQGLLLETEPLDEPALVDLAEAGASGGPLVILDHVTDPHNVGAVLRSAAAFGASGLVMTRRHSPPLTGTLAKSASGALELVPIALVQNLAKAMGELKANGFRLYGLDGDAEHAIEAEDFDSPVGLVLGAEGKGLRQLTAETCDRLVRITTAGGVASLNVSNAAAVALHAAAMRRRKT